jgi:Replication-relaxation
MRPRSTGKRIELVPRDIEIFRLLDRYRYLRSNFLSAFFKGDEKRFIKRLGNLFHEGGYIDRPKQQWQFANSRYMPAIYELGVKGRRVLADQGMRAPDSPLLKKGRMGAYRQFAHAVMISDILASVELGVRKDDSLRFISWQEILANAPEKTRRAANPFEIPVAISHTFKRTGSTHGAKTKIIPDALFGLEYMHRGHKSFRYFALEADRNTMPVLRSNLYQTSYLKKLLAYRQISATRSYKTQFGLPNLLVLNVTTTLGHMENIMRLAAELTGGGSNLFLFKCISTLGDFGKSPSPTPHILTDSWSRAGRPEFFINRLS